MDTGPKVKIFPYIMMVHFLVMGFSSCGGPDDLKPKSKTSYFADTASLLQEGRCEPDSKGGPSPLEKKITELYENATEFTYQYNRSHYPYLQAPGQVLNLNLLSSNPLKPLVLNELLMTEEFNSLSSRWKTHIGENNLHFAKPNGIISEASPELVQRIEIVNEIHQLISTLKEKVNRYNSQLCNLEELSERSKRDVRPMHNFSKALEKHSSLNHPEVENELVKMCLNYNSPGVCHTELMILKRKKNVEKMRDHYFELFNKRQKSFFEHKPNTKFQCHKEEEKTILVLPIEKNDKLRGKLFGTYQSLKETIEEKWSNQEVRVVVQFVDPSPNAIKIKWGESSLSFVNQSSPLEITMSDTLNFSQLVITLTHEIGHVFGFSDCYHEFFDKSERSIIYYSLDESGKNLMCNLNFNTTVPDEYLSKLIQSNCR